MLLRFGSEGLDSGLEGSNVASLLGAPDNKHHSLGSAPPINSL